MTLVDDTTHDVWLDADRVAELLGMFTPKGEPNRRGFLERVQCLPGFPRPLQLGAHRSWLRSEVMQWAKDQRPHDGNESWHRGEPRHRGGLRN